MFKKYNIGIMGAGNIAGVMAATVKKMKGVKLYAVASRQQVKADVFANKYGCKKAYGSYEDLVKDKKVDLIYIATPHSEHYENAKLCILNGKPVLCEKAFTANAKQAEELIALAREKEVLLAEAIWTRYMPMMTTIQEVLGSGIIGELKTLTANLGYAVGQVPRLYEPALAGGALLDLGVYPLNFAFMIFGNNYERIESSCSYTTTGVDEQNSITIYYHDGKMAVLNSTMVALSDRKGIIYGTKGFAIVENINNFESITVFDNQYKQIASYKRPKQISGYEYEVEACIKALAAKELECHQMPHSETLRVMKIMDELRKEWGIVYPFEEVQTEQPTEAPLMIEAPAKEEVIPAAEENIVTEEVASVAEESAVTEEVASVAEESAVTEKAPATEGTPVQEEETEAPVTVEATAVTEEEQGKESAASEVGSAVENVVVEDNVSAEEKTEV